MYVFVLFFCIIYYAYAKYKHSKNVAKATTHVLAQMGLCVFSLALVFCDAYVCHIFDAVLMLASALQLLALLHFCTAALLALLHCCTAAPCCILFRHGRRMGYSRRINIDRLWYLQFSTPPVSIKLRTMMRCYAPGNQEHCTPSVSSRVES